MMDEIGSNAQLHALLIGIDNYLPNTLPDSNCYLGLHGCVRDVAQVQEFLQSKLGMTEEHILKLTASNSDTPGPSETPEQWPTYEHIIAAFHRLTDMAQPGDQVYIHYSGYGGLTPTRFPDLKGANGVDNVLVPMDIAKPETRYLHDVELAYLLKTMVDKGLFVTVVLDCSYTYGTVRGDGGASLRSLNTVDMTPRAAQSLVATNDVLIACWRGLEEERKSDQKGSGLLPAAKGIILLAASGLLEPAYEYLFSEEGKQGALTYWLLSSFKLINKDLTYKQLHARIVSMVHSQFELQTPQLEGEAGRLVFGYDHIQPPYVTQVLQVDQSTRRVFLSTDLSLTIRKGSQFAIYPAELADFSQVERRIGLVTVTEASTAGSWAIITNLSSRGFIQSGQQAVLLESESIRLCRRVRLMRQGEASQVDQDALKMLQINSVLTKSSYLLLAEKDEAADFQVAVNANREYEIWDPAGQPIANMFPVLQYSRTDAASVLMMRLEHLAKYRNIQQLDNVDVFSSFTGQVVVELAGVQSTYIPGEPPHPQPFEALGHAPVLKPGEWAFLRARNNASQSVRVTILDLAPNWSIAQLPDSPSFPSNFVAPGEEILFPLKVYLPSNSHYTRATDVLKVLVTAEISTFHFLELPALDEPSRETYVYTATRGASSLEDQGNPLRALLNIDIGTSSSTLLTYSISAWAAFQVEVQVQLDGEVDSIQEQIKGLKQQVDQLSQQKRYQEAIFLGTLAYDWARQLGEQSLSVADSLSYLANLYLEVDNYDKAEPFLLQALSIQRKILGENHPEVANTLNNLATLYSRRKDLSKAESLLREALQIKLSTLGEQNLDVATSLNNLGMLYSSTGKYTQAQSLLQQALEIERSTLGEQHPDVAIVLSNLALLYKTMGDYAQAEPLFKQALQIQRTTLGEQDPRVATSLNNLAGLYYAMGDYAQAEPLFKQALQIQRTTLGEQDPRVATVLNNLAQIYYAMGDYAQAEPLLQRALNIQREALGEAHPQVALGLANLGALYEALGDYKRAEPLLQRALDIQRKTLGEAHPQVANSLLMLGRLRKELGDYREAESMLQRALTIQAALGEQHPDVAASLNDLAGLYRETGDYAKAEPLYRQALEIRQAALGEQHPDVAASLSHLGILYTILGNYERAEPLLQQVIDIRRNSLEETHPDVVASINNLATLYLSMGSYEKVEQLLQALLDKQRSSPDDDYPHPEISTIMHNLAASYVAMQRYDEAKAMMEQAAAIDDQLIEYIFSITSKSRQRLFMEILQKNFAAYLSLTLQHFSHSSGAVQIALDMVLRRKAIDIERQAQGRDSILAIRYPKSSSQIDELTTLRRQIAHRLLVRPRVWKNVAVHRQLLKAWCDQKKLLERELSKQVPEIALAQQLRTVDRYVVTRVLPRGSVLVEFVCLNIFDFTRTTGCRLQSNGEHYLAFVLPAQDPEAVHMIDLAAADTIDKLISAFLEEIAPVEVIEHSTRQAIPVRPPMQSGTETAFLLRVKAFDPLIEAFAGSQYLILALDAELGRLPFAALPTDDGKYLIDDYHFSYLQTGRDVLRFNTKTKSQLAKPLVIADPDLDLDLESAEVSTAWTDEGRGQQINSVYRLLSLPHLEGTRGEGRKIAEMLGVRPWLGESVLKSALRASLSPRILHMAAPSFFLPNPRFTPGPLDLGMLGWEEHMGQGQTLYDESEDLLLRSGIALAGANTWLKGGQLPPEAEDGLLTAKDVSGLDLSSTNLVVLSACQTGAGSAHISASIAGLQRAFLFAGARTVVMNLSLVPDRQAVELMTDFYRHILDGKPNVQALYEAQLNMKSRYPHPANWSTFICYGDLSPLLMQYHEFIEIANPYVVGLPVTGGLFVGRLDILKMIQDNLAPSAGRNILVLRGQRRTGKTSVLFRLRDTLFKESNNTYVPVVVDVQGMMGIVDESEFFLKLARNIRLGLQRQGIDVPKPTLEDFKKAPTSALDEFLDQVNEVLDQRRILLMLDEFDKIRELIDSGRISKYVLDVLRNLMQYSSLLFLIAGTHKLREFTGGYWSVLFNLAIPVDIGVLTEEDTRWLINEPVRSSYSVESSAVNEIVRIAGCHPYFTQLICKELVDVRNEFKLNKITVAHVNRAVTRALQSGDENVGFPWTDPDCSAEERLVLAVLSFEENTGKSISAQVVRQQLESAGLNVAIDETIKRLHDRGVLRQDDADKLNFIVPLFQKWITQKHYNSLTAASQYNKERT